MLWTHPLPSGLAHLGVRSAKVLSALRNEVVEEITTD
jgi:hypothetical protein